jgi:hypothetical protein
MSLFMLESTQENSTEKEITADIQALHTDCGGELPDSFQISRSLRINGRPYGCAAAKFNLSNDRC